MAKDHQLTIDECIAIAIEEDAVRLAQDPKATVQQVVAARLAGSHCGNTSPHVAHYFDPNPPTRETRWCPGILRKRAIDGPEA